MTRTDSFRQILDQYGGERGQQVMQAYSTWQLIEPWYQWVREKYFPKVEAKKPDEFIISVPATDSIYNQVNDWLVQRTPQLEQKELEIRTTRIPPFVRVMQSVNTAPVETEIEGHPVTVVRDEKGATAQELENARIFGGNPIHGAIIHTINFKTTSTDSRDAVVKFLSDIAESQYRGDDDDEEEDERPWMLVPRYGNWDYRSELPPRPVTSVMLKNGQLDRVINDMQAFLDNEDHYKKLAQPWHRGYLFYGPPGTGKTSMARALSDHFKLPMYWLSLGDINADQDLVSLISGIRKKSILLLEDIDSFATATDRDDEHDHASVAALLNALDGVWTPNGLITIMTTNKPEELDPALIRAGRVGLAEKFDNMDLEQVLAMAEYAGWTPEDPEAFVDRSPAEFMEAASRALLGLEDSDVDELLQSVLNSL